MSGDLPLPTRTLWILNGFRWYVRRFLRKNFHAVRLSLGSATLPGDNTSILIVTNHPSWWDPMLGTLLLDLFPKYEHYSAIDAEMLEKYRVFNKLGFFGIDKSSLRGAAQFLKIGTTLLSGQNRVVWVAAQGEFADVRQRPLNMKPGVAHLAARMTSGWILPIAFEYTYWQERTPEALIRFGEPIAIQNDPQQEPRSHAVKCWEERIEQALTQTLDALNLDAISRDPARFKTLLGGKTGAGGAYDFFRRLASWARLKRFDPKHESRQG